MIAGLSTLRRAPNAFVPFLLGGSVAALAVGSGLLPASPQSTIAGAVFPLDVLFDVKRSIGHAHSWPALVAALVVPIGVRSALLAAAVHLAEDPRPPFLQLWAGAARLVALAVVSLFPGAALFFIGVVIRYAPFVWLAALLTFVPALLMARRATWLGREDQGRAAPAPYIGSFLVNAAGLCLAGAAMSGLAGSGSWISAMVLLVLAPIEAAFFFGWRAQVSGAAPPERSRVIAALTAAALLVFGVLVAGDRMGQGDFGNRTVAGRAGTLVLLGGVDSTSERGSLAGFDVRFLGWQQEDGVLLSYSDGPRYSKADTHSDLGDVAVLVGRQIGTADRPVALFGHSQAALILDRMVVSDLALPDSAVVISSPPHYASELSVPAPGETGPGKPGGDLARGFSWLLDRVGLSPFDVDAPAIPRDDVVPENTSGIRRMSVWALGDSVWLDSDWRRRNEVNVVSISDHVGALVDRYVLEETAAFFAGEDVGDDEGSWRGALATGLRFAFAPWRP